MGDDPGALTGAKDLSTKVKLAQAVVDSLGNDQIRDLIKDRAKVVLEDAFSDEWLTRVPFVGAIFALGAVGVGISDRLLVRKLILCMSTISEIAASARREMVERLEADPAYKRRVGEHLIELLDRVDSHRKPAMVALVFVAFAKREINATMLHRLLNAIERIPTAEIDGVRAWAALKPGERGRLTDPESLQAYGNAGLSGVLSTHGGLAYPPKKTGEMFIALALDLKSR
jgi:hypothetical protein